MIAILLEASLHKKFVRENIMAYASSESPAYRAIQAEDDDPLSPSSHEGHRIPRKTVPSSRVEEIARDTNPHVFSEKPSFFRSKGTLDDFHAYFESVAT